MIVYRWFHSNTAVVKQHLSSIPHPRAAACCQCCRTRSSSAVAMLYMKWTAVSTFDRSHHEFMHQTIAANWASSSDGITCKGLRRPASILSTQQARRRWVSPSAVPACQLWLDGFGLGLEGTCGGFVFRRNEIWAYPIKARSMQNTQPCGTLTVSQRYFWPFHVSWHYLFDLILPHLLYTMTAPTPSCTFYPVSPRVSRAHIHKNYHPTVHVERNVTAYSR